MILDSVTPMHHQMIMGRFSCLRPARRGLLAVVATLTKGYDLDYIWSQVDRAQPRTRPVITSSQARAAGSRPARWWGPGAQALGFEPGQ